MVPGRKITQATMNPSHLFSEVARQNKLLKETIHSFSVLLDEDPSFEVYHQAQSDHDETASNASFASIQSPTLSTHSTRSAQPNTIGIIIDLLNRQESRLNLLEAFGINVLLNTPIPIFRGLPPTKQNPDEIGVQEWCAKISDHLKTLKSLKTTAFDPKTFVTFVRAHLELKPAKLLRALLERNRLLVRTKLPNQVPPKCVADFEAESKLLLEYPFRLHVLRHPRAFLNLLQSKFTAQKPTSLQKLNRIAIRHGDSLLLR